MKNNLANVIRKVTMGLSTILINASTLIGFIVFCIFFHKHTGLCVGAAIFAILACCGITLIYGLLTRKNVEDAIPPVEDDRPVNVVQVGPNEFVLTKSKIL